MNESTKSKLLGRYSPSILSVLFFAIGIAPVIVLFSSVIARAFMLDCQSSDIGILAGILFYCAILSEVNFRYVNVDEKHMLSHGPLRIYRQNLELCDVGGIRLAKARAGSTTEVQYRGRWIVFASNRRFKRRIDEVL